MRLARFVMKGVVASGLLFASAAFAHDGDGVPLHVDDSYSSCFFDLHPELTQAQFDEFAGEAGAIMRFHALTDARTLGAGRFDVSLVMGSTGIDDSKGAWNNTMSHPTADHYLGHEIQFPRLVARVGVIDGVDVGAWGSLDPRANYGFIGLETKVALWAERDGAPLSMAVRPNVTVLLGPEELWALNGGVDVTASRSFYGVSPYLGLAVTTTRAIETSDDVMLDTGTAWTPAGVAGVEWNVWALSLAAEVEVGALVSYGLRAGGRF